MLLLLFRPAGGVPPVVINPTLWVRWLSRPEVRAYTIRAERRTWKMRP